MSVRTQAFWFRVILSGFLAVFAQLAESSPTSDAQEQLNKAYDDYYDAISTGAKKTPEEQKQLRDKMVDPAMKNLSQAVKQETDEVVREHAKELPPSKARDAQLQGAPSGSATTSVVREKPPETVLESTDIPRELEFPGKPAKASPSPSPLLSPKIEPYLGPFAPKSR